MSSPWVRIGCVPQTTMPTLRVRGRPRRDTSRSAALAQSRPTCQAVGVGIVWIDASRSCARSAARAPCRASAHRSARPGRTARQAAEEVVDLVGGALAGRGTSRSPHSAGRATRPPTVCRAKALRCHLGVHDRVGSKSAARSNCASQPARRALRAARGRRPASARPSSSRQPRETVAALPHSAIARGRPAERRDSPGPAMAQRSAQAGHIAVVEPQSSPASARVRCSPCGRLAEDVQPVADLRVPQLAEIAVDLQQEGVELRRGARASSRSSMQLARAR